MKGAPPLRFLAVILGGWVCLRAAMLSPDWVTQVERLQPTAPKSFATSPGVASVGPERSRGTLEPLDFVRTQQSRGTTEPLIRTSAVSAELDVLSQIRARRTGAELVPLFSPVLPMVTKEVMADTSPASPRDRWHVGSPPSNVSRWSGSAWAFVRRGSESALSTGSMLGGSQVGGRIGYRINDDVDRPLSIAGRLFSPVNRRKGSEAALGLDWKPVARLPMRVLAERRQAVGIEGRSALAIMAHGGVSDVALTFGLRLEVYAQAGIVGARSRDLFADASAALTLPLDEERRLSIGGALWGAAQPGISRVDAGPRLSLKLPGAERVRVLADWRFRVHGNASPASGPSLTLATDF